jgi:hypothetical protein
MSSAEEAMLGKQGVGVGCALAEPCGRQHMAVRSLLAV